MSKVRLDSGGWMTVNDRNRVPILDINSHKAIDVQVLDAGSDNTFVVIVDINPPKPWLPLTQEPKKRWWRR